MPKDLFERWDAGRDPHYEEKSRQVIEAFSSLVPWDGSEEEYTKGLEALVKKVKEYASVPGAYDQVIGGFFWWAKQPVGNETWRTRVQRAAEYLSIQLREQGH